MLRYINSVTGQNQKIVIEKKEKADSHDTEFNAVKYRSKGAALINAVLSENMAIHAD